ncbi:Bug family tripartite tricarboxylate transporter substrate binding protein [Marinivivus vitaminiproducens]|uniref:Bug family tripartite tricarboxylate transporter substrate binding protein n=1 Tax=Marinivivus vitaminiproducens TaxID=3035935 RepID=UPI0027A7F94D|nr:tripartite tricarboxylate transporter substrate binding protein [Geminicoccaceae bacterium SCSIO 64248]
MQSVTRALTALAMGWLVATPATAQDYPARSVTVVVGANPGGGSDTIGRLIAQKFSEIMGVSVVVENRPGASNTIGASATAKAEPDGHTLFVAASTPVSIAPHLIDLDYDTLTDLQPVGLITLVPNVLVVNNDMGVDSVDQLVSFMKEDPGAVKYGSSGFGTTHVILAEQFNIAAGVESVHVPYPGSAPTQIDIIAGVIQMTFDTVPAALSQIKAGNLKPIAVTSPERLKEMPDVPTIREAGYPQVEMQTMYALYTTGGTPRPVVDTLNATLAEALNDPYFRQRLLDFGGTVQVMTTTEFEAFNREEYDRYGEVIRKAGIAAN